MAQDWTSFTLKIGVKASLETMYNAWTRSGEIERWFLEACQYTDDKGNALDKDRNVTAGCDYKWSWYLYDMVEDGKIVRANGKDLLQFTFAGDCLVDITLEEAAGHVMVQLMQHNIPADEASKFRIRIGCLEGWTFYLANLKSFYENGFDLRNKVPELKGLNN